MIISASRRTDIPALYGPWLLNRLAAGYVLVRNPVNPRRISRVALDRAAVDCLVFWSKNPAPFLPCLSDIERGGYLYYFQFTLTPYGRELEAALPPKAQLLRTFCALSARIGAQRVVWRYDPIILSDVYPVQYHIERFTRMAQTLAGAAQRCVISFVDDYAKLHTRMPGLQAVTDADMHRIAQGFAGIAARHGLQLFTCAEAIDLSAYGIGHSACIDAALVSQAAGRTITAPRQKNPRPHCRCVRSVDIGAYDSCAHGCLYCYANRSSGRVRATIAEHDPRSPLLIGWPGQADTITDIADNPKRPKRIQFSLFDSQ